jgi:hypothetical protein
MGFLSPKQPKIPYTPPPPYTPTRADTIKPLDTTPIGAENYIATGSSSGLKRKSDTAKRSLIG